MGPPKLLIIEDHDDSLQLLQSALGGEFEVITAGDTATALALTREQRPNVTILDLALPPNPTDPELGLRLLKELQRYGGDGKIIVCTGYGKREHAIRAVSLGAYDFLTKPIDLKLLRLLVRRASWIAELEQERLTLPPEQPEEIEEMIGTSEGIRRVFTVVRKVATTDVPILVIGESGTGKELTAKAIHERSLRNKGPFVTINCGAIPENLLESELFGHEKGSFTGAYEQKKGKVEYAQGGTLLLDEIGELSSGLQVKLLRFLQDQTIERVGGRQKIKIDARIIAATNADLREAISRGRFRDDLYHRLSVIVIDLPPLRERGEDALLMAQVFLKQVSQQMQKRILGFTREAIQAIQACPWPGNVRELINKIRRAVVMAEETQITPEDLALPLPKEEKDTERLSLNEVRGRAEANALMRALAVHNWNMRRVAQELEITPPTLYHLLRKYGLGRKSGVRRPASWPGVKFPGKPSN